MSLGQRVMRAMGWSAAAKVGFQIIAWAMTLAVIRVPSPDDYGLMALSMVCINLPAGFCNLGLGEALVRREHTPKPLVASVFGLGSCRVPGWWQARHAALLHGSAVKPGESVKQFQHDTYGVGEP